MEGERMGVMTSLKTLPDELVEKIVLRMPFPSIWKARHLSKSWKARLSPISLLDDDEEMKRLAIFFQRLMVENSVFKNWPSFCPVGFTSGNDLIGYHQASHTWQTLPSLFPTDAFQEVPILQIEGALVYGIADHEGPSPCLKLVYVGNILTHEWKRLPHLPYACHNHVCSVKLLNNISADSYKLLVVSYDIFFCDLEEIYPLPNTSSVHVYDSKSETWTTLGSDIELDDLDIEVEASTVYLDGILYIMMDNLFDFLLELNVGDFSSPNDISTQKLPLIFEREEVDLTVHGSYQTKLVACNADLLVILIEDVSFTVRIMQIDLGTHVLSEVAHCEPAAFNLDMSNICLRELNCFFLQMEVDGVMLAYDKRKDEWSFFFISRAPYELWNDFTFQPGLNPFIRV